MPLQKLQFRPGVNREGTTLANEGGWFDCDNIRFRSGFPEKLGGWVRDGGIATATLKPPTGSYWGVCRSMWNWNSLQGANYLALGTNLKYYIQVGNGGNFYDITPLRGSPQVIASGAFTTTTSSPTTVTVNAPGHGAQNGDFVTISSVSGTPGGIPNASLTAEFQITYIDPNQYRIVLATGAATSDATAGAATFTYQITTGLETYTVATGWGAGSWGGTVTGTVATTLATALVGTTLSAAITSTATTINVVSTTGFASPTGSLWISQELITYTGTTGTSFTGCTRGTSGTTALSYTATMPAVVNTTSVVLTSASGFAASGTVVIDGESITYGAISTNTLTGCTRGANGSTPSSHAVLAGVTQVTTTGNRAWTGWGQAATTAGIGVQLRLWSESNYGEDLIFNPRGGALYYWAVNANPNVIDRGVIMVAGSSAGGVSLDASFPSVANHVMVSDASRFVICFGTNDPSIPALVTQDPLLIRWSNQEDYGTWIPAITNQAGDYRLSSGSEIVTAQQSRQEILVWTDAAIYSMQYLGPPYVWGFQIMGDNISIAGPNVVATANNVTYWMGTDKFYMYSGRVETLPCSVRQYVYDNINMLQSFQFFAGTNEGYNEVWWFYCSANSNIIDKYVIFNHLERTWYYGDMERTAWLDSPLREQPMATFIASSGGAGSLLYHETGNDDGTTSPPSPIVSYCQSSDFDIGDGHNFGLVSRIVPDLTFDGSDVATPIAVFTVRPRQNPGANYGTSNSPPVDSVNVYSPTVRTYNVQQFTQYVYVRVRGRQMAFRVGSDNLGTSWQLGTPRIDVRPDGRR
jgi:hypothetical protein